ncbi:MULTISPECIES: exonuclease domain-containing protein [unclassified Bradyrhizobium]|uniref:exonuclease domain-containing protein n=1 Tax=unclassified Bradyrhizobium TaxID=2631580 RepID=UPI0028E703C8|nr:MULTISPECIES: exonuclease domain-containing protein [unclassified Bradyrhizobium]
MGFVFYDTETTGTDTSFDQVLQFAAIHTDFQFNELGRFERRCRLLPHVVPAPGAMRVTKVTAAQLTDPSLPSHYEMICDIRQQLLAWSPALFVGYNSVDFDEHLLRQAFYKTLHPPYLTNTNSNSRSDALRIAQATSIFVPDALLIPTDEEGQNVFKLDQLAPLNGFVHDRAHDAMADVEATIFLCRLIADKAPEVWSSFMRFSQKAAVADHIAAERVFCLSDFYFGKPYSWLVTTLGTNPAISSEFYVYNLAIAPEEIIGLTDEDLVERLAYLPKPVRRLKTNACPMLASLEDAPSICSASSLDTAELNRRADLIQADQAFRERLIKAFELTRDQREPSPHIEEQLYDSFFPREDEALMQQFHLVPWEDRLPLVTALKDRRLRQIGLRLIYTERADLLEALERERYDRALAIRIMGQDAVVPWLTLPKALADLDELLDATEPSLASLLREHRDLLSQRLATAIGKLEIEAA